MFTAKRSTLLLVPLWALLTGCPHRVDFGLDGEPKTPEELLRRITVAESAVFSVKGEAKLRLEAPDQKGVVTLFAAVTHPAYIHLESLDFFGKPQGVLVSDGTTFGIFDGKIGKYFHGPASAAAVGRILPIALPPAELGALLLGRAPRIPQDTATMGFDPDTSVYTLTLKRGAAVQTLTVSVPSYRVTKSAITGVDAYDLEFENLESIGATTYPRRVVLVANSVKTRIELNYKDVAVNEPPDMTLYEITAPANVPVVEVDERGVPRDAGTP